MGSVTDTVITAIVDNRSKFEAFCRSLAADAEIRAWVENPFVKGYQAMMNH